MSITNAISVQFHSPWLLLLLIPALLLPLLPFMKLKKQHRNHRGRISSLVLRILSMILLVFIVAGMNFESRTTTIRDEIIILVDASDSTRSSIDRMNVQIQSIIEESAGDYNVGIITFANGNIYNVRMTKNIDMIYGRYINSASKPNASGTNIAVALSYARSQIANPTRGRIIMLTDGLETDGLALNAVRDIAKTGIRIDTIYFSPNSHYFEFQVNSVEVPSRVNVGETIELSVGVQSTVSGSGVLKIYDNSTLIYQESIMMNGYEETFMMDYMFNTGGLHELYFEIIGEHDTVAENNSYYAFVNIDTSTNILIVDGTGTEASFLVDLLGNDHAVSVVGLNNLPNSITALQSFDEVILMNVANSDLPESFVHNLEIYVRDLGGGLLTIGGSKAYVEADMTGSILESMLPVQSSTSARPMAVMYVLDSSGSMNDMIGTTGKTRFQLAKEGAIAAVNQLNDRDYFGLVSFNSAANLAIPMRPASQRESIIEDINLLTTASGTKYKDGLELAASALKLMSDVYIKHIIFITDGTATDDRAAYTSVVEGLSDFNITLSGIAIYRSDFLTSGIVRELSEIGEGRYYYIQNAAELPNIMVTESQVSAIDYINEGLFVPEVANFTSVVTGITDLPQLGGYYGTLIKENATMVLTSKEELPVYASWSYGSGRVGSFTSDLNGDWSVEYFIDEQGTRLIKNLVSSLFPEQSMEERDIHADFINTNHVSQIEIAAALEANQTITAKVTSPMGTTMDIYLNKTSDTRFSGEFMMDLPGIYTIAVSKRNDSNNVLTEVFEYTAFSYSSEYNVFSDTHVGFQLVESISELGNGKILYLSDGAFSNLAQDTIEIIDPRYLLFSLMIACFILDIFARKFKFKWPHEIIRDVISKQQLKPRKSM
jgi:Ca-activated chloride channel homolog